MAIGMGMMLAASAISTLVMGGIQLYQGHKNEQLAEEMMRRNQENDKQATEAFMKAQGQAYASIFAPPGSPQAYPGFQGAQGDPMLEYQRAYAAAGRQLYMQALSNFGPMQQGPMGYPGMGY